MFCSFSHEKTQSGTRAFHDLCCSKPLTFHNGFMFFMLLEAVSSTFSDSRPYFFQKSSVRPGVLIQDVSRVYWHHAHMLKHMCAWGRFESTHGSFQRATPHRTHTTTTTTATTTHTSHHTTDTTHNTTRNITRRQRRRQRRDRERR